MRLKKTSQPRTRSDHPFGGVSLYGIRRFPVTFYLEEWERILGMADEIRDFMTENQTNLKRKGQAKE